jgi:hypothetical protein
MMQQGFARFFTVLAAALLALSPAGAQEFAKADGVQAVGRAKVVLPPGGQWVLLDTKSADSPYGGSHSGAIPADYKVWALLTPAKELRAVLVIRASAPWGYAAGTMQWAPNCKADPKWYVVDQSGHTGLDCLIVRGRVGLGAQSPAPFGDIAAKLVAAGITLPGQLLAIQHNLGNDKGSFIEARVLTSVKFRGAPGEAAPAGPLNTIHASTARWADLLAQAARGSLGSMSGEYKLPDMNFSE